MTKKLLKLTIKGLSSLLRPGALIVTTKGPVIVPSRREPQKSKVQEMIEAAAKPLIAAGEKNPTARLLDVWKKIPGQGEPKNEKELANRQRAIRRWTAHLKE